MRPLGDPRLYENVLKLESENAQPTDSKVAIQGAYHANHQLRPLPAGE